MGTIDAVNAFDVAAIDLLVTGWIRDKQLPGAVLDISLNRGFSFRKAYGGYDIGTGYQPIVESTLFDVASLTKVVVTLPAILFLIQNGEMKLDASVQHYIPAFRFPSVTIRHLLSHSSGLPADLPRQPREQKRDILAEILRTELLSTPGENTLYSDLGMILLGTIVSKLTGQSLNTFACTSLFVPLGMTDSLYCPPAMERERVAPTESRNGVPLIGEVHDEKSWQLGGISGSAGLFATAADLRRYTQWWLEPSAKQPLLSYELRHESLTAQASLGRGLGWELWNGQSTIPFCGSQATIGSFGHTGFTGTSLWIDPVLGLTIVFLTNAVHYGRDNAIRQQRTILHQLIYTSLLKE